MDERPVPTQTEHDGPPRSPTELDAPDWKESLKRAVREFKADRGTLSAAGMAFYWFLAVFPALIAAVGVIGLLHLGDSVVADIKKAIGTTLPGDAKDILVGAIGKAKEERSSSIVATVIGLALALWSASSGMVALQGGMDIAYDIDEDRKLVKKRTVAVILMVVAALLGGVASAFIIFGKPLGQGLGIPDSGVAVVGWTVLRWVLGLATLSLLFACFYYFGPNREKPRWTWISPGGIVATVIWLLASLGFSFYVSSFNSYAKTYGSFTGVVVLLLWLYLSAIAIMVGAELNAELERQGERKRKRLVRQRRGKRTVTEPDDGAERQTAVHRPEETASTSAPSRQASTPPANRAPAPETPAANGQSDQDAWLRYGR